MTHRPTHKDNQPRPLAAIVQGQGGANVPIMKWYLNDAFLLNEFQTDNSLIIRALRFQTQHALSYTCCHVLAKWIVHDHVSL
jgi:hypothetical protein